MIVIPPIIITSERLVSSSVYPVDAGETAWTSGGTYALGDVRTRAALGRRYEAKIAHSGSAVPPEDDAVNWREIGATNRMAMFDMGRMERTIGAPGQSLDVRIRPGRRINALYLGGLVAAYVDVYMFVDDVLVWSRTNVSMSRRRTRSWRQYYYGEFRQQQSLLWLDLPPYANAEIRVVIRNGSDSPQCAALVVGQSEFIGDAAWGADNDELNFSTIERDKFSWATLIPRRAVPNNKQTLRLPKQDVDRVRELRRSLNAVPAVYSTMDQRTDDPWFESFLVFGIYTRFRIKAQDAKFASIDLETEEL
jgi:hypothetical protein